MKKLLIIAVAALCGSPFLSRAAITYDNSVTAGGVTGATTAVNLSIPIGCSKKEMLVVATAGEVITTTTGVTVGGQNATLILRSGNTTFRASSLWYFLNASGTESVTSTYPSNAAAEFMTATSYCGVNQTSPIDASSTNFNNSNVSNVTGTVTTTAPNDWIEDAMGLRQTTATPNPPQTLLYTTSSIIGSAFSYRSSTASGSYSMAWSFSPATTYSQVIVAFKADSTAHPFDAAMACQE